MRVIYVDDEQPALDNFRLTVAGFLEINSLELFRDGEAALNWTKSHRVDAAFLDMEMPGIHGIGLALRLREINPDIRVVFVTAYCQYAMDAWGVDATGYILKPYSVNDVYKELRKCMNKPLPTRRVVINTIPTFSMTVDGTAFHLARAKTKEMLALLVDRGERGITAGEGISYL